MNEKLSKSDIYSIVGIIALTVYIILSVFDSVFEVSIILNLARAFFAMIALIACCLRFKISLENNGKYKWMYIYIIAVCILDIVHSIMCIILP